MAPQEEKAAPTAAKRKYLLVIEHTDTPGHPNLPIVLEVVKESPIAFVTREVFAVDLRDLSPGLMRKKLVRWSKETLVRMGDAPTHVRFRIKEILGSLDDAILRDAIVVYAN